MTIQIATPQKGTSWPGLITEIEMVGETNGKPFPVEKIAQLRSVISGTIKPRYPERVYKAKKTVKDNKQVAWIWRES